MEGMSLGDTLKQNRQIKEHLERERAISKIQQTPEPPMMRIRPATPSLNLLKMKKQKQLALPLQPLQSQADSLPLAGGHPALLRRRKKVPHRLTQLQPLQKLPQLPGQDFFTQKSELPQPQIKEEIPLQRKESDDDHIFDRMENSTPLGKHQIDIYEDQFQQEYYDEEIDFASPSGQAAGLLSNFQEKFEEIIENQEVEDAIELNEKFLAEHLGVQSEELSRLTKIELRVDTSCHNLQVTGEILSSLESLRMSDSVIKCFRDIGTSFKFVRILHLARCELKEVQGIQAFINLEELYISYNQIDDLFDISFLEHLSVLDFEGNNVKTIEQLKYLKRCKILTDVNLKYNPVSHDPRYCDTIVECIPSLSYLDDDQFVPDLSFSIYKETAQTDPSMNEILNENSLLQRLYQICGITNRKIPSSIQNLIDKGLLNIRQDDSDMEIMVNNIKSYSIEKKAQRQFFDNLMTEDVEGDLAFIAKRITPAKDRSRYGSVLKQSNTSINKSSVRKYQNDENDSRASNGSEQKATTPEKSLSFKGDGKILKIKKSKIQPATEVVNESRKMPLTVQKEIIDNEKLQGEIRYKVANAQSIQFYGSKSLIRPPSVFESNNYTDTNNMSRESLVQSTSAASMINDSKLQKLNIRASFGSANSYLNLNKGGPIKADRIVLRAQDIQFSENFKKK